MPVIHSSPHPKNDRSFQEEVVGFIGDPYPNVGKGGGVEPGYDAHEWAPVGGHSAFERGLDPASVLEPKSNSPPRDVQAPPATGRPELERQNSPSNRHSHHHQEVGGHSVFERGLDPASVLEPKLDSPPRDVQARPATGRPEFERQDSPSNGRSNPHQAVNGHSVFERGLDPASVLEPKPDSPPRDVQARPVTSRSEFERQDSPSNGRSHPHQAVNGHSVFERGLDPASVLEPKPDSSPRDVQARPATGRPEFERQHSASNRRSHPQHAVTDHSVFERGLDPASVLEPKPDSPPRDVQARPATGRSEFERQHSPSNGRSHHQHAVSDHSVTGLGLDTGTVEAIKSHSPSGGQAPRLPTDGPESERQYSPLNRRSHHQHATKSHSPNGGQAPRLPTGGPESERQQSPSNRRSHHQHAVSGHSVTGLGLDTGTVEAIKSHSPSGGQAPRLPSGGPESERQYSPSNGHSHHQHAFPREGNMTPYPAGDLYRSVSFAGSSRGRPSFGRSPFEDDEDDEDEDDDDEGEWFDEQNLEDPDDEEGRVFFPPRIGRGRTWDPSDGEEFERRFDDEDEEDFDEEDEEDEEFEEVFAPPRGHFRSEIMPRRGQPRLHWGPMRRLGPLPLETRPDYSPSLSFGRLPRSYMDPRIMRGRGMGSSMMNRGGMYNIPVRGGPPLSRGNSMREEPVFRKRARFVDRPSSITSSVPGFQHLPGVFRPPSRSGGSIKRAMKWLTKPNSQYYTFLL